MKKPDRSKITVFDPPVGPIEDGFLRTIHRYHYLTARQVTTLLYSAGSRVYVSSKLKRLADNGYLKRLKPKRAVEFGSSPYVYTLGMRGRKYLAARGEVVPRRYRPSEEEELSELFLSHTIAVNDFLVATEIFCRNSPGLDFRALLHERDLRRVPIEAELDGERIRVVPDAWLAIGIDPDNAIPVFLELDQGTMDQRKWRKKIANIVAILGEPHKDRFGVEEVTIAVSTTAGEKRAEDLCAWTEAELINVNQEAYAGLFHFTSYSPQEVSPEELYLGKRWLRPLEEGKFGLLDGLI